MERKQIYIVIGLVIFVALIVVVSFFQKNKPSERVGQDTQGMDLLKTEATTTPATFVKKVPQNAVITTPIASAPAAPNTKAEFGIFNLTIDKAGFHPSSLTVKRGNVVQIKVTSLDDDYDMWIPHKEMYWLIPKGDTKPFTFTALETGTFLFQCRDACPSGKILQGILITLDK